jgi:PEGA domain
MTNPWHPRGPHGEPGGSPHPNAQQASNDAAQSPHHAGPGQVPHAPPALPTPRPTYSQQMPSPSPFAQRPPLRPSQYRVHVPDPTVIVMRPRRPRGLVISVSVLVTLGLVVGGLLAYGNLHGLNDPSNDPSARVAATASEPAGGPGAGSAGHGGAVPAPGPLAQAAGAATGLPEPTVTPLRAPATPAASETPATEPVAAVAEQPVPPAPAGPPPGTAPAEPARPALAVPAVAQAEKAPAPAQAWLELEVEPADATVTVAGEPYRGSKLERMGPFPPGPLALRIEAPEHETIEQIVELGPGETERMSLALPAVVRGPGKFRVRSSPSGATVLIDGKVRGVTPATLELTSGRTYELALSQQGYEPWRTLIEPEVGKTQKIAADMERLSRTRTTAQKSTTEPARSTPEPARPTPEPPATDPAEKPEPEPAKKERDISVPASMVGNAGRGRSLFERCRSCHGSSAPALSPRDQTQSQWSRFLALRRHSRHAELRPLFSVSELADVKAYLLENAADVERGMAAGVR